LPSAGGRFKTLRSHARGGLGEVFVARDEELGREVALKVIQSRFASDPNNRSRFVREAEITGNLEHPGIVPVYGFGRAVDGVPYYAMKLIRGESLDAAIARFHAADDSERDPGERAMSLLQLIGRFKDACNAVGYAHSRGVLHRDLKPSNIMLGEHGETLVVDWGLAKPLGQAEGPTPKPDTGQGAGSPTASDQTLPGARVGTPAYMSPEQAAGRVEDLRPASDVYNLGATLYCLLTGRPPFDAMPLANILARAREGTFPPPRDVAHGKIPPPLEAICLRAMALRPEDRYASPGALAEDIDRWIADEPVLAHQEGFFEHLTRWSRRHRAWVRAGAVVMMGLLVVFALATAIVHSSWQREQVSRLQAEALSAELELDQAVGLCEQGATGRGMLRLAHALSIAPTTDQRLRRSILVNTAAWRAPLSPLVGMIEHEGIVRGLAVRPDGKAIATCGDASPEAVNRGEARLWNAQSGEALGPALSHPRHVNAVAFHPGGVLLLTGSADGTARIWDTATGKQVDPPLNHDKPVVAVAFAPDGRSFLTVSGRSVRVWDMDERRVLEPVLEHPAAVATAKFSPDGSMIATGSRDERARLWDTSTRTLHGSPLTHQTAVHSLAFSPDGQLLATGTENGVIRFWETSTQHRLLPSPAHRAEVYCMTFSPDGRTLLSGSEDNTARIWDVATGQPVGLPLEHANSLMAVAFSPDGRTIVTDCADATTRFWSTTVNRPLRSTIRLPGPILDLAYDSSGSTFATADTDGKVRLWNADTLQAVDPPLVHPDEVNVLSYSRDGRFLVTGCADGKARVWDLTTNQARGRPFDLGASVTAVAFGPSGTRFLAGSDNTDARMCDAATGEPVGPSLSHRWGPAALAFSPDGRTALAAEGDLIRLWDVVDGSISTHVRSMLRGHHGVIDVAVFSPDGRMIATGGEDNAVRLWDSKTGHSLGVPLSHDAAVVALAFSADGKTILSGSHDRTARLWDVELFRPIGPPLIHGARAAAVAVHPDGRTLLTGSGDHIVRLWDVPTPLIDDAPRVVLWVESLIGFTLQPSAHSSGLVLALDAPTWRQIRQRLASLGGPPTP
jgi:WD40 repeat protein